MANPLILFENILEDGTLTATSETAGFPIENVNDWRLSTGYRWKATSTAVQNIDLDLGAGPTANADTICIAGHNITTTVEVLADNSSPPTTTRFTATVVPALTPFLRTFTAPSPAVRYWRIQIAGLISVAPQIGIVTLGRRIDFERGALMGLDPYQVEAMAEEATDNNGAPIGVNVVYKRKAFQLAYGGGNDPGMTDAGFFTTIDPNFDDDFVPHAIDSGKPFWFGWNIDVDAAGIYLCKTRTISMPFVGTTARRGLSCVFDAYSETT